MAVNLTVPYNITPARLGHRVHLEERVAFTRPDPSNWNDATIVFKFGPDKPITLPRCGKSDFALFHTSPISTYENWHSCRQYESLTLAFDAALQCLVDMPC